MVCGIVLLATSLPSTDSTPVPPLPKPGPSYLKSNTTVLLAGRERRWAFPLIYRQNTQTAPLAASNARAIKATFMADRRSIGAI